MLRFVIYSEHKLSIWLVFWITVLFANSFAYSLVVKINSVFCFFVFFFVFSSETLYHNKKRKKVSEESKHSFCLYVQICCERYSSPLCLPDTPTHDSELRMVSLSLRHTITAASICPPFWEIKKQQTHLAQLDSNGIPITYSCIYAPHTYSLFLENIRENDLFREKDTYRYSGGNW